MTQDSRQSSEGQTEPQAQQSPVGIEELRTDLNTSRESLRVLQGQYDQVLSANHQWAAWAENVDSRMSVLETQPATAESSAADPYGYSDQPDAVTTQLQHISDRFAREDAEKQALQAVSQAQASGSQHIADAMREGGFVDAKGKPDNSLIDWSFMKSYPATVEGASQATMAAMKLIAAKSGEARKRRANAQEAEQKQVQVDGVERQRQLEAAAVRENGATATQVSAAPGTPPQTDTDRYNELVKNEQFAEASKLRAKIEKDLRHGVTVPHPTPTG